MTLEKGILGYLSLKPMSGYDIKKVFNMSAAYFWPADQAQIYRTLKNLEDDGLIEVCGFEQEAGPSKKLYKITKKGRECLHEWLTSQKQSDFVIRRPFLMQLFFSGELSREKQLALIDGQKEQAQVLLKHLHENYEGNERSFIETAGLEKEDPRFKSALWTYKWGVLSCETYLSFLESIREACLADIGGKNVKE